MVSPRWRLDSELPERPRRGGRALERGWWSGSWPPNSCDMTWVMPTCSSHSQHAATSQLGLYQPTATGRAVLSKHSLLFTHVALQTHPSHHIQCTTLHHTLHCKQIPVTIYCAPHCMAPASPHTSLLRYCTALHCTGPLTSLLTAHCTALHRPTHQGWPTVVPGAGWAEARLRAGPVG